MCTSTCFSYVCIHGHRPAVIPRRLTSAQCESTRARRVSEKPPPGISHARARIPRNAAQAMGGRPRCHVARQTHVTSITSNMAQPTGANMAARRYNVRFDDVTTVQQRISASVARQENPLANVFCSSFGLISTE
jgi:hypothetical protein